MKQKNSGRNSKMPLKAFEESSLLEDLKDPDFAAPYLEEVLSLGSMPAFLHAVRNVAKANGGMKQISHKTNRSRESLYKALSEKGNPQFSTLQGILKELGLRFSVICA